MATQALSIPIPIAADPERARLSRWLACWVALPNLGFCLLWAVGTPPRYPAILIVALVGLLVRRRGPGLAIPAFLAALGYAVLSFVAATFNLAPSEVAASIRFLASMAPAESGQYLLGGAAVAVTGGVGVALLRRSTAFASSASLGVAAGAVALLALADFGVTYGARGSYNRIAPAGAPFGSAVERSGFGASADRRHLILVMVESMGQPLDADLQARLHRRWRQPDVAARYSVTTGTTPYYASTTSGELRELCGRWGEYQPLIAKVDPGCLPARLAAAGYRTTAMHSFAGGYFDRTRWYPNIGFQQARFGPELLANGAKPCPGVFPGACDRDVPRLIERQLADAERPHFIYWLTVNSHLPVIADARLNTQDCARFDAALAESAPDVCRLFRLFADVDKALAETLLRDDFPAADILIVGDHMPPYFTRASRSRFDHERVPWVLLRRRT